MKYALKLGIEFVGEKTVYLTYYVLGNLKLY
jgi:hypothetical protein